jgi:hypothetical protein
VNQQGVAGYDEVGAAGAGGPFTYTPGMASSYGYRVKFVQGSAESEYGVAALRVLTGSFVETQQLDVLLPLVGR